MQVTADHRRWRDSIASGATLPTRARRLGLRAVPQRLELPARFVGTHLLGQLEPEIARLDEIAPRGTAVDVGANHGLYSYSLVRRGHPVVAFEPQPWCARTLRRWAGDRVRVYEMGLSDSFGILPLHIPLDRNGRSTGLASLGTEEAESEVLRVPVVPLDAFEMTDVSFMKIDVEGHEDRVLRGAERTIERCSPTLLVEISAARLNDDEVRERFDLIQQFAYDGSFLHEDAWLPLSQYSIERFQRLRLGGDESAPLVYNFVFRHRAK